MGMPDQGPKPGIAIMMFDARGEAHARSEQGFKWAFDLPGAQAVATGEMPLRQLHAIAETFRDYQGNNMFWLCAPLIAETDDETLVRAWKWYEESIERYEGLGVGSTVLLEFMQEVRTLSGHDWLQTKGVLMEDRMLIACPAPAQRPPGPMAAGDM